METPVSQADILWKELFTEFHSEAISFFFGRKLYNSIDFSVPPEYLEQEFNVTFAEREPTKKVADKVIRYQLKDGNVKYIILHVEFQGSWDDDFALRMYLYFVYIFIKYGHTDVTALAIYTGASRPKEFNCYKISNYGTTMTYKFNTYIVRLQNEERLKRSRNPFSIAVLASLYLIKAGQDDYEKLEYKKKLVEIATFKNFDRAKLVRLLNFVQKLVTLPPNLEEFYQSFITQPQIQRKMEFSKEFLQIYAQPAIQEVQDEALEKGIEKGIEKMIMEIHNKMGFNAQQIANITSHEAEYIQTVLDKYYKNNPK